MPNAPDRKTQILIAFACVYFFWGSTYGAIHIAALHLAPPLVGALRTLISSAILCAFCVARGIGLRVSGKEGWQLTLIGVLFMSVNNVLLIWAEQTVPSGFASLVIAMIPIFVAVIESALPGGETLNLRGWLGTLLGAAGMVFLLWPSLRHTDPEAARNLFGYGLLIVAALAFAIGSILSRRFKLKVNPFSATAWQLGAASAVNFAVALLGGNFHTAQWTTPGILAVLYLAVFGSVVGLTAYVYLLQHVPVTKVSTYAFVNPVIAVLLGVFLLKEHLTFSEVAGMVVIVAGVATVILSRTRTPSASAKPEVAPRASA